MASINMLVSEVVHALGQPNSKPLRENVKSIIIHTRNELIRQSYEINDIELHCKMLLMVK